MLAQSGRDQRPAQEFEQRVRDQRHERGGDGAGKNRSEEHTSELQSP